MSKTDHAPIKRLRWLLPTIVLLVWVGIGGAFGSYAGKLSTVQVNDSLQFLPASAESTVVANRDKSFVTETAVPAIVVYESDGPPLEKDQIVQIQSSASQIAALAPAQPGEASANSGAILSEDGAAAVVFIPIADIDQEAVAEIITSMRDLAAKATISGVSVSVGGPAGFVADLTAAFAGIDGLLLLVALVVVLVILLIVYRSPVLPFMVLFSSVLALSAASAAIYGMAVQGWITLNGQAQGILSILVIGAATDYALLLVARYREELRRHESKYQAMRVALRGVVEPVLASGGTVILAVLVLLLSDLKANQALGPVAAIGIVFSMLVGLTFLPAVLVLLGRGAFWPFRPAFGSSGSESGGVWAKVAGLVDRRPKAVWISAALGLAAFALFLPSFRAEGVPQSQFFTSDVESTTAQASLERHFPGGSGSETIVITPASDLDAVTETVMDDPGVATAFAVTAGQTGPPGTGKPLIVDETAKVQVTLVDAPDSIAAEATVVRLRSALDATSDQVLVGGPSATQYDTVTTAQQDNRKIIPVVLLVIFIVLCLLLRAIVLPVLLVATVVLSFAATLGLGALVFNHVLDFPGADPSVPLFAFVFLVALGIDYNIFLMTRAREETILSNNRAGMLRALTVTGGVITSAGIVLAATFGALGVLPLLFLFQIAFLVSVGVLIDTFIVRSLLVPGFVIDLGPRSWWPSRLAHEEKRPQKIDQESASI